MSTDEHNDGYNRAQWPCDKCSSSDLCDDCFAIKRAEARQREAIAAMHVGNRKPDCAKARDTEEEATYKPVKRAEGPPIGVNIEGEPELPSIFYAPTPKGKTRELRSEAVALVKAYEDGVRQTSDPVERERLLALSKLIMPMLDTMHNLGQDSVTVKPTLRYCPLCPNGKTPLDKNKQYCPEHLKERRKEQYRLSKRRQRSNRNCPQCPQRN